MRGKYRSPGVALKPPETSHALAPALVVLTGSPDALPARGPCALRPEGLCHYDGSDLSLTDHDRPVLQDRDAPLPFLLKG